LAHGRAANRPGAMPPWTAKSRSDGADLLLRHANSIELLAAYVQRETAKFANSIPHAGKLLCVLLHQKLCPIPAATLFIAEDDQDQITRRLQPFHFGSQEGSHQHGNT